jgi:hypothetical protein
MAWSRGGQPTPAALGTPVDLSTQNPDTCFACAYSGSLCTNGQNCNATFYAASGQMTLTNDPRIDGGWVEFQLTNVAFRGWDRINHRFPPGSDCVFVAARTCAR